MYRIFCIHSSVEGHLGSFQLLAITSKTAMNIVEHVSFLSVGTSSGYMPRRGKNPDAPQQRNGYRKCGTFTQWNTTQLLKKFYEIPRQMDGPGGHHPE